MPQGDDTEAPYKDNKLYKGFVVDDRDPAKQGRVLVMVPGVIEPGAWAEVCMPGSPFNRGDFVVPVRGGQVLVGFEQGELDSPVCFGGLPPPVKEGGSRTQMSEEALAGIRTWENEEFVFVLGKSGSSAPYAAIYTRDGTIAITLDIDSKAIKIEAPVSVEIETKGMLSIKADVVKINDRVMSQHGRPF